MTASFHEQAGRRREQYLSFYRHAIEGWRDEAHLAVELLIRPNGRTTPAPFCLVRLDAIFGDPGAPRIQRVADFAEPDNPATFELSSGLKIRQDGFSWEALRLRFTSLRFDVSLLRGWLDSWLDPGEVREPDSSGLSGVVHDLAWSKGEPDTWQLDVDLGSAPIAALEGLLEVLSTAGVTDVRVARHDRSEP
jgi:hypothetical protein